ncbi:MAG: hypothetical protein RLN90_08695 [Balneolaceae bacterium]
MKKTDWKKALKDDIYSCNPPTPKRKNIKGYRYLYPINLKSNLKEIEVNPPKIIGFSMIRLEYILHLILSHKQKKDRHSYSILNMEYLRKVVPQANDYIKFLGNKGFIEWKNYSKGRNSRLYRLVEESKVKFKTITDPAFIKRIEKAHTQIKRRNSRKYPHLNKWIKKTEIDFEKALSTIRKEYQNRKKENKESAERSYSYCLGQILRIQQKEIYISVNDTNNRLDSNFTNLPSILLKHLEIDGKKFIEMDIKNSQPFFVLALLNPSSEAIKVISDFDKSLLEIVNQYKINDYVDTIRYLRYVCKGNFYDLMARKFNKLGINCSNRNDLKSNIFIVFFGKPNAHNFNDGARIFKIMFPTVYSLFKRIKAKGNNRLAILLQRLEAHSVLEIAVKRITNEFPDLPILTRHDSILIAKDYNPDKKVQKRVQSILRNSVKDVVGFYPPGRVRNVNK